MGNRTKSDNAADFDAAKALFTGYLRLTLAAVPFLIDRAAS
jgi:hypothetical protein